MLNRTVQGVFLAAMLLVGSAMPAAAQSLGVGVSFMGDHRGSGVIVDYSKPFQEPGQYNLGWVGELGYNHKGYGNDFAGIKGGVSTLLLQGGVRMNGKAGDKLTWIGQGLVGLIRTGVSFEAAGFNEGVCDAFNVDCSAGDSDLGAVITPGVGLQYALNDRLDVRGQLDFPIAIGADGGGTSRFSIMLVLKRGR